MITAAQMDEYSIQNGLSYYPETSDKKDFSVLEEQIREREQLQYAFTANNAYNSDSTILWNGNVAIALTDARILYGKKNLLTSPFRSIDICDITGISQSSFGKYEIKLEIEFFGKERIFFGLNSKNADKVISGLEDALDSIKRTEKKEIVSVADELLKFKQLLDMNAITPEEYEKKKKELLGD